MPARKKGGKSLHKKQQATTNKTEENSLSDTLFSRIKSDLAQPQHANVNVSLLESLLIEDQQQLKNILRSQSNYPEKLHNIVNNIIESKVDLLVSKILGLLERESHCDYLFPWLLQIYNIHEGKLGQERINQMLEIIKSGNEQMELLLRVDGKLELLNF